MKIENVLASPSVLAPRPLDTFITAEPAKGQGNLMSTRSIHAWQGQLGPLPPGMGTKVDILA